MRTKLIFVFVFIFVLGCEESSTATKKEAAAVDKQDQVYVDNQPVPFFDWSLERHVMVELYKAKNEANTVWFYVLKQGNLDPIFMGVCVGIPVPGNTQLTNPQKMLITSQNGNYAGGTVGQAEPNGLYSSPSTASTYVMVLNDDGTVSPTYFEDNVAAVTFPSKWDYEKHCIVRVAGKPSISITTKKPGK